MLNVRGRNRDPDLDQNIAMKDHQILHHLRGNLDLVISQL